MCGMISVGWMMIELFCAFVVVVVVVVVVVWGE